MVEQDFFNEALLSHYPLLVYNNAFCESKIFPVNGDKADLLRTDISSKWSKDLLGIRALAADADPNIRMPSA